MVRPFVPREKPVIRHLAVTSGGSQGLSLQDRPFSVDAPPAGGLQCMRLTAAPARAAGGREGKSCEPLPGFRGHAAGSTPS